MRDRFYVFLPIGRYPSSFLGVGKGSEVDYGFFLPVTGCFRNTYGSSRVFSRYGSRL